MHAPSRKIVMTLAAAALASALACGCSTNPVTGRNELILIPANQEIAIGVQAAPQFAQESGGPVPDATLQAYISEVGGKVAAVSDRQLPYEFTLVASKVPNAFALPGGKIFVTAGLMARMTNERQLAAVLAHEVVHAAAKHSVKQLQKQMGASVLIELAGYVAGADKAAAAKAATEIATNMGTLHYSRSDEYQADEYGLIYLARAGYNPWGMVELLNVLYGLSETEPDSLTEMFQTHPLTSKRIAETKELIENNAELNAFSPETPDPQAGRFAEMRARLLGAL